MHRRLAPHPARVELGVGGVEVVDVEGHRRDPTAVGVDLGHAEMVVERERSAAPSDLGLEEGAGQREPLASGSE